MKKFNWKTYLLWILIAEAVGGLSGWLIRDGIRYFNTSVIQPPLSPPPLVFPIVWSILYALMGFGAARVSLTLPSAQRSRGLNLFIIQLAINFCWSLIFFNLRAYGLSFFWILLLCGLVFLMTVNFRKTDILAANLQVPYLLWLSFAAYLNFGVWYLNR